MDASAKRIQCKREILDMQTLAFSLFPFLPLAFVIYSRAGDRDIFDAR